jgi:hypothetical protein
LFHLEHEKSHLDRSCRYAVSGPKTRKRDMRHALIHESEGGQRFRFVDYMIKERLAALRPLRQQSPLPRQKQIDNSAEEAHHEGRGEYPVKPSPLPLDE